MKLQEILDKPRKFTILGSGDQKKFSFETSDGEEYIVELELQRTDDLEYDYPETYELYTKLGIDKTFVAAFTLKNKPFSYNVMGGKKEFEVFSTVIDILKRSIKAASIKSISFLSKESNRTKLYSTLVKKLSKSTGMKLVYKGYSDELEDTLFILKR